MGKIIVIDAGHGINTVGKRCLAAIDPKETREWYLNNQIAEQVQELLKKYNCRVIRADDPTGEKNISLADRVYTANTLMADVYVSIHHNAGINGGEGGGTTVFYYSSALKRPAQAGILYYEVVSRTRLTGNRSQPVMKQKFYVLKNTKMPAFLIENGFMDSSTDTPIILTKEHAQSTAEGITAFLVKVFGLIK